MKKISHFCAVKKGDYYLFEPISQKDKRKTIVVVKDKTSEVFACDENEIMKKFVWKTNLNELVDFYSQGWSLYKLNEREKLDVIKELIVESL